MKIKFDTVDKFFLNKVVEIPVITIVVRGIFTERNNFIHKFS